jgi:hypothetical protein
MNLKFSIVKPQEIDAATREEMFQLMDFHYANTFHEVFIRDLEKKTDVIMLYDPQGSRLVGFSTQKIFRFSLKDEEILVLFSGDTIIMKEYWGSLQLSLAFGKLMVDAIHHNPDIEFYWMLISKGVRTFKFLPAYFIEYYPKYGIPIPVRIKQLIDGLACYLYPLQYDPEAGVVRALPDGQYLREDFQQFKADGNKDVNDFFILNPGFSKGDELVCLTRLSIENIRPFIKKALERAYPAEMINNA